MARATSRRSPCVALAALLVAAGALATAPDTAEGQRSGGRFGSSGFGGGGSRSSSSRSSSSRSSSWRSSPSRSSSGSSSRASPSRPVPLSAARYTPVAAAVGGSYLSTGAGTIPAAEREVASPWQGVGLGAGACLGSWVVLFAVLGALGWSLSKPDPNAPARRAGGTPAGGGYALRRVSIAFDWNARARIQAALDQIAQRVPMGDDAGRRDALLRTTALLLESIPAARYAAHQSLQRPEASAERDFVAMTDGLRARYRHETRGQGALDAAPALRARADEGLGLVVVTLVVCGLGRVAPLPPRVDRDALASILRELAPPWFRVVALEVVWSPAEENDRMSSAELEVLYPELLRVDHDGGVGRVQCAYCSGVFPAELGRCPACGAPGPAPGPPRPPARA